MSWQDIITPWYSMYICHLEQLGRKMNRILEQSWTVAKLVKVLQISGFVLKILSFIFHSKLFYIVEIQCSSKWNTEKPIWNFLFQKILAIFTLFLLHIFVEHKPFNCEVCNCCCCCANINLNFKYTLDKYWCSFD